MEPKRHTCLVGARSREYNFPVPVYDDGDGPVWLFGDDAGTRLVIRAASYQAAWEIAIDEATPIPEAEVPEAYGFYGAQAALRLRHARELADAGEQEHPELVEGYEYQSNATGTGIVNVSDYAWLREWSRDDLDTLRLVIRSEDCPAIDVLFEIDGNDVLLTITEGSLARTDAPVVRTDRFHSFSVLTDVGGRLGALERAYRAVNATVRWAAR